MDFWEAKTMMRTHSISLNVYNMFNNRGDNGFKAFGRLRSLRCRKSLDIPP